MTEGEKMVWAAAYAAFLAKRRNRDGPGPNVAVAIKRADQALELLREYIDQNDFDTVAVAVDVLE